jgi:uncharacterized membrane protein
MNEPRTAATADRDLAVLVRSVAALISMGVSAALAMGHLRNVQLAAFISGNSISAPGRKLLLLTLAIGAALGLGAAAALYLPGRHGDGLRRLTRAARLLAPLALVGFVPTLVLSQAWSDPVKLAIALGLFVLAQEPLWRLHFSAYLSRGWRSRTHPAIAVSRTRRLARGVRSAWNRLPVAWRRSWPTAAVVAMALFYIAYMSFFTVRNHHRFNTYTWDLGQINNQFYNFLHGHPFRCTALIREGDWSELRNHAEATMFFLLPIYALWPAAETLLVLQAVLLGAAGLSLYRFSARRLSRPMAAAVTAAYYLYPPLHGAQFFDIHFQPLAAAFLLAAIDFFDSGRMRLFVIAFVLAIGCREDIPVGTAIFGLFLILTGHRTRAGVVILIVSVVYFVALRFVIMPAVGTWGFAEHYHVLFPEGERSFVGIVKTMISNPIFTLTTLLTAEKLRYALQLFIPIAFLPLRRAHLAMSVLPGAYFTFLTTEYPPTLDIGYQYSGYFVPYIFPATALALAAMARPDGARADAARSSVVRQRAAVMTMVIGTILATIHWGAIPPRTTFHSAYRPISFEPPTPDHEAWRRGIHELDRMVPRNAILAVTDREMPHVANRVECWNLSVGFVGSDYIIHTTDHPLPQETEQVQAALRAGYVRVAEQPGLVLLKRPGAE